MNAPHDEFKRLDLGVHRLARCPVCGAKSELWQYSLSPTDPTSKVVMCSRGEDIGPRTDGFGNSCLLVLPPQDFYRATMREAVAYWNGYAAALATLRAEVVE